MNKLALIATGSVLCGIVSGIILGDNLSPLRESSSQDIETTITTKQVITDISDRFSGLHETATVTTKTVARTSEHTTSGWTPIPASLVPTDTTTASTVPATNQVLVIGREFWPVTLTVSVGTTVTWVSKDGENHTVTDNQGLFNHFLPSGTLFSFTYTQAGTFPFHCEPHTNMKGQIIVQ